MAQRRLLSQRARHYAALAADGFTDADYGLDLGGFIADRTGRPVGVCRREVRLSERLVTRFGEVLAAPGGPAVGGSKRALDETQENGMVVAERMRALTLHLVDAPASPELDRALLVAIEASDSVLKLA